MSDVISQHTREPLAEVRLLYQERVKRKDNVVEIVNRQLVVNSQTVPDAFKQARYALFLNVTTVNQMGSYTLYFNHFKGTLERDAAVATFDGNETAYIKMRSDTLTSAELAAIKWASGRHQDDDASFDATAISPYHLRFNGISDWGTDHQAVLECDTPLLLFVSYLLYRAGVDANDRQQLVGTEPSHVNVVNVEQTTRGSTPETREERIPLTDMQCLKGALAYSQSDSMTLSVDSDTPVVKATVNDD
jgi:hypothetical protein